MLKLTPFQKEMIQKNKAFYDDIDDYYYSLTDNNQIKFFIVTPINSSYMEYIRYHFLNPLCTFWCESEEKADSSVMANLDIGISAVKIII